MCVAVAYVFFVTSHIPCPDHRRASLGWLTIPGQQLGRRHTLLTATSRRGRGLWVSYGVLGLPEDPYSLLGIPSEVP